MSTNSQPKDIHEKAFILSRTNYGEADRILNILTKNGKISAMAKGARKEKSKLAGNIEPFCLIDINVHQGKNEFGVVTSAKMLEYYSNLVIDLPRMEFASLVLKKINAASENSNNPEFFSIVSQILPALNNKIDLNIAETWFWFNLAKASGEEVNVYRDVDGNKLQPGETYIWDTTESALRQHLGGNIDTDDIKIMRLMLTSKLALINQIKNLAPRIPSILHIAKSVNKL